MARSEKVTTKCDAEGCSAHTTRADRFTTVSVRYEGPDGSGLFERDFCGTHGPEVLAVLDQHAVITIPRPEGGE